MEGKQTARSTRQKELCRDDDASAHPFVWGIHAQLETVGQLTLAYLLAFAIKPGMPGVDALRSNALKPTPPPVRTDWGEQGMPKRKKSDCAKQGKKGSWDVEAVA
ncbi:hypothetical protein Isop_2509 [Isosphaera pallida ATCC 43644]|uniref:Uncharacterized protein n=1 Tax=Isosphaera pallida (strain ATCC 43644 / DSM 9630 / IS1B) TaxID=575540 RepID=E8QY86_ISOPI|nr:hypothetical protein Isop_2509 [Isosphaera pallida ATCC 43644]